MQIADLVDYLDKSGNLIGLLTEAQALALADVRHIRRKRDGKLLKVKDRHKRLGYRGITQVARAIWQGNDGRCYEQELSCHRVYALRGHNI